MVWVLSIPASFPLLLSQWSRKEDGMEPGDYGAGSGHRRALVPFDLEENVAEPPKTRSQFSRELGRIRGGLVIVRALPGNILGPQCTQKGVK